MDSRREYTVYPVHFHILYARISGAEYTPIPDYFIQNYSE